MATTTNVLVLLKFFASKQNSPIVDFIEFCDYMRKYSEHNIEEQPALSAFLDKTEDAVQKELDKFTANGLIVQDVNSSDRKIVFVTPYLIDVLNDKYRAILVTPTIPFPAEGDLPKHTPKGAIVRKDASELIPKFLKNATASEKSVYGLILPHDAPTVLLPGNISVVTLVEDSLLKLQTFLKKEDRHDFFLKKLTISNPGKELSSKNFFNAFVDRPDHGLDVLKESTENFYLWHQLCYFIKQDYEKIKDFSQEDLSTLEAVYILEIASNFFKSQNQNETKKNNALKSLEANLDKPPYYFTFDTVTKFTDKNGVPLLGQYSEEDLKEYLHSKTTDGNSHELPDLLVFKTSDDSRYFINKKRVLQLIMRFCSDARSSVRDVIKKEWTGALRDFEQLPEMHEQDAFERRLESEVRVQFPILHSLLSSSFLQLLNYNSDGKDSGERVSLFTDGVLLPYSELLLMNRAELYTDAKILLPFWYTVPVISWIAKLLFQSPKAKKRAKGKTKAEAYRDEESAKRLEDEEAANFTNNPTISKRVSIKNAARDAETSLVPESSTLDQEIESYLNQWNRLIDESARNNLTEDVNVLIRDYVRKVIRTMKSKDFSAARIKSLADSLVKAPALQKIKDHDALQIYIQLYIIKLVKNIQTI